MLFADSTQYTMKAEKRRIVNANEVFSQTFVSLDSRDGSDVAGLLRCDRMHRKRR